jgi:2,3-bisphosphoglycerate-independent phosphoglycerate mutase
MERKKVLLIILDGFGVNNNPLYNATLKAKMPNFQYYKLNYSYNTIEASSVFVGLPEGQFGNSEVGHLNIGAGRVIKQDITRIDDSILNGEFFVNQTLSYSITQNKTNTVHIMGLCSDGGVHSHIEHIFATIKYYVSVKNITQIWLHLFLDGRDCPPRSALQFISEVESYIIQYPQVKIASICGRYYAMDRDKRYDRLHLAYNAIINASADNIAISPSDAIHKEYQLGRSDEFILPYTFNGYKGIKNGDIIFIANFRADRIIQLLDSLINQNFAFFPTKILNESCIVTMTQYDKKFNQVNVVFPPQSITNSLGEYIANLGMKQLRIAETEKYPHVTYFFSGGRKDEFIGEDRILIASPRDVATYDEKPEMSLPLVSEKIVAAIESAKYDVIITNFANPDMVGHTGNLDATVKALEFVDEALAKIVNSMLASNGEVLITADHGNCELMYDELNHQPHTQHTTNLVPLIYIGRNASLKDSGSLQDIAPTLLAICGLEKPIEMTGDSLILWQ